MKCEYAKCALLCVLVTLLFGGYGASAAEIATQAGNPIANADFENGGAGWQLSRGAVTEEGPHAGKACLRMERTGKYGASATQFITLEPDTWYVCEFYYKLTGTPGYSHIRFMGDLVDGARGIASQSYLFDRYEKDEWTRGVNHVYSEKGGRCELEIRLFINPTEPEENLPPTAALWLDDIVLRPMDSADMKGELIENGDFEDGRPGFLPPGWTRRDSREAGFPTVSVTDQEAHAGKQSLQIAMGAPRDSKGAAAFIVSAGRRRLLLGRTYTLSFWAKSSRPADSRFGFTGPASYVQNLHLTPEWQQFSFEVMATPEQQAAAKWGQAFAFQVVGQLLLGDVTIWYDDVSVQPAIQQ